MARRLENLALVLAVLAIGLGLFMLTYWVTQAIVNGTGNPFPNVQHASTYPHPATR